MNHQKQESRDLKSVTVEQIEKTIAKALSQLVGTEYYVEIVGLDFVPRSYTTEIKLKASKPLVLPTPGPKSLGDQ